MTDAADTHEPATAPPAQPHAPTREFDYQAQSAAGHALSGRIRAHDADEARGVLENMGMRVLSVGAPSDDGAEGTAPHRQRAGAVAGADFHAFNQQLAQLTAAGLPVERGLRLIAQDMRRGRMAESVRRVAEELERGVPLAEAFEKHRQRFPTLYARLIDVGVRSGQLPQVLFNLGRHLDLVGRLRTELWRGMAYPLVLFAAVLLLLGFFGAVVGPQFAEIYEDFDVELPALTRAVLAAAPLGPVLLVLGFAVGLGLPLLVALLRPLGVLPRLMDSLGWMPLVGPVLMRSQLARWCDALRVAVEAGLDLPAALSMASETVGSPRLMRDADALRHTLEGGSSLNEHPPLQTLPGALPVSLQIGSDRGDLPTMLRDLAELYQQQAETRLAVLQIGLAPAMLVFIMIFLGVLVVAMFLPLVTLMESLM